MDCEVVLRKPDDDNVLPFVKVLNNERARIEELERQFNEKMPSAEQSQSADFLDELIRKWWEIAS